MYKTINKSAFMDEFQSFEKSSGRYSQLGGYQGLSALFDYLENYEEETGEKIELDVIALCCDYSYYESLEDLQAEYGQIKDLDDLRDNTQVIEVEGGGLIIQNF